MGTKFVYKFLGDFGVCLHLCRRVDSGSTRSESVFHLDFVLKLENGKKL